ncbi:MAG: hypothetical protein RIR26_117 [Pseudomonadota bacterium]|jgi:hypothetical protein
MRSPPESAFAFLTDIHGNLNALDAVLEDIHELRLRSSPQEFEIVCLGDSFDGGADPLGVFERLRAIGCVHLRGNHEEYLFDCQERPTEEKFLRPLWKFVPWTVSRMGDALKELRASTVPQWRNSDWNLSAVHASVSNNGRVPDFFTQQSSLTALFKEEFLEHDACQIFFNGHSHYLGRHWNPQTRDIWFNCGSVGYPFVEKDERFSDAPLATWVWVECRRSHAGEREVRVLNRRVPYSSDAFISRYVDSGALEECAPFSFAIAAQSLFNTDVVYPFFQKVKKQNLTPDETARLLVAELERQQVFSRINALLSRAGRAHVAVHS